MADVAANPVFDLALAYQKTAALKAAIELNIFNLIAGEPRTAAFLSQQTGASARGLRILCDYLTVNGLLMKEGLNYSLRPSAKRFLDPSSPSTTTSAVDFLAAPEMLELVMHDPASYVRRGGSEGFANIAGDHPVWVRFARAMTPFAALTAKRVAAHVVAGAKPPRTVLDIACGHGLYGIEVARAIPNAVVTAVDWAPVLAVACENADAAGVRDRYRALVGSAFEVDLGQQVDLVLVPNLLHHFSFDVCVSLLRRVRSALSRGGQAFVIEFVPNDDRVSPPVQASFAFWMLATTPGGDAYPLAEIQAMALEAGFASATAHSLHPIPETLVVISTEE
jgi:SAM-dependent methyltransferase